jgi:hypothetical protein
VNEYETSKLSSLIGINGSRFLDQKLGRLVSESNDSSEVGTQLHSALETAPPGNPRESTPTDSHGSARVRVANHMGHKCTCACSAATVQVNPYVNRSRFLPEAEAEARKKLNW